MEREGMMPFRSFIDRSSCPVIHFGLNFLKISMISMEETGSKKKAWSVWLVRYEEKHGKLEVSIFLANFGPTLVKNWLKRSAITLCY